MDKALFLTKVMEKCGNGNVDENSISINPVIIYNKWIRPTDGEIDFFHIDGYLIGIKLNIILPIQNINCGNNPPLSIDCISFCYINDCTITEVPDYIANLAIQKLPTHTNINILTIALVIGAGIGLWYISKTLEYKLESSAARRAGVKYIATD